MADIAIRVEQLSKQYEIGVEARRHDTIRDTLVDYGGRLAKWWRAPSMEPPNRDINHFWALKDVSFEVKRGQVVGIIGRNGAGKSTLLKILSRITEPTSGRAEIHGRVGSLLEVGTGFDRELTGRDNVYLNGAILGMRKTEIERKFDEIVEFAGVGKFIDTPVKRYSSGMYVRLAFAVAAHLEPEVLIVDEVLAVGDAEFRRKCLGKMGNIAQEGRTILFVSHNLAAVQNLCAKACWLENGQLVLDAEVNQAVASYLRQQDSLSSTDLSERADRQGDGSLRLMDVALLNGDGERQSSAMAGEELVIALGFEKFTPSDAPAIIRLGFKNLYGERLFMCLSRISYPGVLRLPVKGQIRCRIPRLPLVPGRYTVSVSLKLAEEIADSIEDAFAVDVSGGDFFGTGKLNLEDGGNMLVQHQWEIL